MVCYASAYTVNSNNHDNNQEQGCAMVVLVFLKVYVAFGGGFEQDSKFSSSGLWK